MVNTDELNRWYATAYMYAYWSGRSLEGVLSYGGSVLRCR